MWGDIVLWFNRIIKQHITCVHDYKVVPDRTLAGIHDTYVCRKCDRRKKI